MKEKLVEEWLIRARERGGIDHGFGQWLISQGHEILWLGHSRTEFGKDIISISPDGVFHAYQIKDEEIDLKELRRIRDQISELVEVPPVHPRIPAGSSHEAHLVTSGLIGREQLSRLVHPADHFRVSHRGFSILERKVRSHSWRDLEGIVEFIKGSYFEAVRLEDINSSRIAIFVEDRWQL